jgi:hypothetical protein
MSHRDDVEAALPKLHVLKQNDIQRAHIEALLAIDDSLRAILAELRPPMRYEMLPDLSEDE